MSGNGKELKKLGFDPDLLDSDSSDSSDDSDVKDVVDAKLAIEDSDEDDDSDLSSGSDMEVDEAELQKRLDEVNEKLLQEPYNYDLLVTKIDLLRTSGELELMRAARERMSQLYPLTGKLWLEWIQDELKLSETPEEKKAVSQLFERAVKDYLSVDVWLEYIQFALSQMGEPEGIQNCRSICERAVAAAGLHVSLGSLLWDAYRDFEAAILGLSATEEDRMEQEKRYINLCKRQLSVPLLGIEEKFEDITSKIDLDDATVAAYQTALKMLQSVESLEQELILAQDDLITKAAVYRKYIETEKTYKSKPARIQCLYERAVSDCPLDSSLWLEYLQYLQSHLKIPDLILNVAERASRNCPWVLEVWTDFMVAAEKCDPDRLVGVFEKAVTNFATVEQVGTLWLKYLESHRRLVRAKENSAEEVEKFVKSTIVGENHILQVATEGEPYEYVFQVAMLRLRLEASSQSKQMPAVRESWTNLLQRGYGYAFRNWLQYLLLEKEHGDVASYRQQLSKAVSYVKDDLHSIASLWLNFERDHGDVSHLQACEKKISKFMQELSAADVAAQNATWGERSVLKKGKDARKRKNAPEAAEVSSKKKKGEDVPDGEVFKVPALPGPKGSKDEKAAPVPEAQEPFQHDPSKDNRTAFVSNLAFTTDEANLREFFADVGTITELRIVKDFKGRSKGFAYVVFESHEVVAKALSKDRHALGGRPVFVSRCDPDKSTRQKGFKFATRLEKNKLFVKGLPKSITEDELRNLFSPFGLLKDARLATLRNGYSKGHAYIDYEDESSANKAVREMNDKEIQGQQIFVAISNPPPKADSKNLPSDMQILQRRAPSAFVPRSLQVQRKTDKGGTANGQPSKPMSNEDFKKLLLLKKPVT